MSEPAHHAPRHADFYSAPQPVRSSFEVSIPNAETVEALREACEPDELTEYSSLDELKAAQ